MDTQRRLRAATPDDIAGLVALLRLRTPISASRARIAVERILAGPSIALVLDHPLLDGLAAALLAQPISGDRWSVDALAVRRRRDARSLVPALLSAAADRLFRSGIDTLVVPVDPSDVRTAEILRTAGLTAQSWTLWRGCGTTADGTVAGYEPGLTLPHLHGLRSNAPAVPARVESASAMASPTTLPFGCAAPLEEVTILDPLVATDGAGLAELVSAPWPGSDDRSAPFVAVALGPGEESLDAALRTLGFRPLLDWWAVHLVD